MRIVTVAAVALCLFPITGQLHAQAADTPPADKGAAAKAAIDTAKNRALFTRNDAFITAGFVGSTFLVARLDRIVAENLQDTARLPSVLVKDAAKAFNLVGIPGAFIVGGGMYLVGVAGRVRGLADAGLHTGEAVVLAEVATTLIKWSFGRERPYFSGTGNPNEFKFGRGLKGEAYSSFPSGHASGAFAAAAAATAEVSSRFPHATIFVAPLAYGTATMVAWARLQSNKHWLSDVFMAAGMGTLIGIKTVRYNHKHPHNPVDRLLLPHLPAVVPTAGGVRLMWTFRPTFLESPLIQ
jgi:membrane-associated phospholipid phosphatase